MKKILSCALIIGLIIIFSSSTISSMQEQSILFLNPQKAERIMIVAPHPDDESLGASGLIKRAISNKHRVRLVVMTYGDSYLKAAQLLTKKPNPSPNDFKALGMVREKEAISAATHLGIPRKDVRFLGYPDGALIYLWRINWDYDRIRKSNSIKTTKVSYDSAARKGAVFCGENVVKSLSEQIKEFKPTQIYYTTTLDINLDHWATGAFIKYTLYLKDKLPVVQHGYLIHHYNWLLPLAKQISLPLQPPKELGKTTTWLTLPITKKEITTKTNALNRYPSQQKCMYLFFQAFIRKNELFTQEKTNTITRVKDVSSAATNEFGVVRDSINDVGVESIDLKLIKFALDIDRMRFIILLNTLVNKGTNYFVEVNFLDGNKKIRHLKCAIKNGQATISQHFKRSISAQIVNFSFKENTIDLTVKSKAFAQMKFLLLEGHTQRMCPRDRTELKGFIVK